MSDFNKYSNYTEESSFSSVVFGSNRPLLEVELNEVQQIIDSKFTKIMKALGVKILFLSDPTYSDGVLTIDSALVFEEDGGYIFEVKEASIECGEDNEIYLQIEEKVVDSSTELHSYGNSTSDIIANHIKDERYPTETAKRKCVTYTLMAGSEVPNSTDTIKYIGVAKVEGEDIIYTDSSNTESLLAQAKSNFTKLQGDIDKVVNTVGYTKSKNLLKLAGSVGNTLTANSVTIDKTGKNTYSLSGTSTKDTWFELGYDFRVDTSVQENYFITLDKNKTYCTSVIVSGTITSSSENIPSIRLHSQNNIAPTISLMENLNSMTFTNEDGLTRMWIYIPSGTTLNNVILKLQLEEGTEVTEFEEYVEDVDTRLKHYDYIDIMDKIKINSENCTINQAFVKNGNVYIIGFAEKQTTVNSHKLFTINESKYRPFYMPIATVGTFNTPSDVNKVANIAINPEYGVATMWNIEALDSKVYFNFIYPLV